MSEELKSAREFYHLLYDLDPEEAIPLMEARDKLIEEAARLAEAYRVLYEVTKVWERNRATPLIFHDWLRIEFDMKEAMIRAPGSLDVAASTSSDSASQKESK